MVKIEKPWSNMNIFRNVLILMCDKLYYYSKSRDVYPGKGANEFVSDPKKYKKLSKTKNWRRILSNFYVYPFKYKGNEYSTVEHAFQAEKISLVNKVTAQKFIKGGEYDGTGEDARSKRKVIKLEDKILKEWNRKSRKVMKDILFEKYIQCSEFRNVLNQTNNCEIWHIRPRQKPLRMFSLEEIRNFDLFDLF